MLLSTGERQSCALCAMAINDLGHRAISLTGSQAGHRHRHVAHQGADPRGARRPHPRGPRRGPHRARRRLPGRLDRARRHDARPRRLGHDRGRAGRGRRRRGLRDLHRRPGRVQRRPADRPRRAQAAGRLVRRDARDGGLAAPACCSCAASSTRATTACASTADRASTTAPGTFVVSEQETMEHPLITAVTHSTGEARVTLMGVPDTPGVAGRVDHGARRGERQRRHDHPERAACPRARARTCRSPSRATTCAPRATRSSRSPTSSASSVVTDEAMGKVSIVGAGMKTPPGRRGEGLHDARRQRHQHRDDLHLADPHLLRRPRATACPTPCARCTAPSSSRARTRSGPSSRSGSSVMRVAVVGATGAVGHDHAPRSRASAFPADELVAFASRALGGPRARRRPRRPAAADDDDRGLRPRAVQRRRRHVARVGAALRRRRARRRRQLERLADGPRRPARRQRGQPRGDRRRAARASSPTRTARRWS